MKLLTLTLAPAIDVTYQLKHSVCDGLNRADSFSLTPGGKGINVSRAVRAAAERDGDTAEYLMTVAPIGGESGAMFCSLLERESLPVTAVEIAAPLRVNVSAVPTDGGSDCEINAPGAAMTEAELARAEELLLSNVSEGDVVCICGSCPTGVDKAYPAHLCAKVKARGAYCIIDCDGEALRAAVASASEGSAPDFIKPNADELSRLCADLGLTAGTPSENARAVCALTGGRTSVIATLGGDGCLLATTEGVMTVTGQRVKPKRIKGAGDTFLGAFVYARFIRSLPLREALHFASATATAYVGGVSPRT